MGSAQGGGEACRCRGYALWFIAGVAAGAALGLLYAPASGAKTRRAIAETASTALGAAREALLGAKDAAENLAASAKSQSGRFAAALSAGIEESRRIKQELSEMSPRD